MEVLRQKVLAFDLQSFYQRPYQITLNLPLLFYQSNLILLNEDFRRLAFLEFSESFKSTILRRRAH